MLETGYVLAQRYEILRKLGQGGSARVYLAYDRVCEKNRALKEVVISRNRQMQDIARREAEFIWSLNYPYFPELFEILTTPEADYIVMEYLEGETLANRLHRLGPQPWREVRRWGTDLCLLLDYLHHCTPPVIYQDMKPDNVMVQPRGNLRLIDFGSVLKIQGEETGFRMGTRGYAAPEQYDCRGHVDARTDIYGLGKTLYQLLSGKDPGEHSDKDIRGPGRKRYPGKMDKVIQKCLRERPQDRYQSCQELREALSRI
ncbi:MAG: serine/threonine protein kinase [Lachnospiraceae bacterium]|nr:serine/threonine protein kinase [Lachnospiraceae bacterium]